MLQKFHKMIVRLPLNLKSNRWFVIIGGRLFISSRAASRRWEEQFSPLIPNVVRSSPRVYQTLRLHILPRASVPLDEQGFLIPHLGRFGNAVREVATAAKIAGWLNLGHLYLHGDNVFASNSDVPSPGVHRTDGGPKVWIDSPLPRYDRGIQVFVLWLRNNFDDGMKELPNPWPATRAAIGLDFPDKKFSATCLVIHLRGGDVFGSRDVANYGQPPLSYYLGILDHQQWESVKVVHQDERNPVLEGIVQACLERKLPCERFSGTLLEDLQILLRAQTLVAGRGTFMPAVVGLSQHVSNVYFFEDKFVLQPDRDGVRMWRVIDKKGDFKKRVLSSNWTNSADQRSLMLSYPSQNLSITREK